jgi:hypothetical protein
MGRPLVTELLLVFEPKPQLAIAASILQAVCVYYPELLAEDALHTRDDGRIELHIPKDTP